MDQGGLTMMEYFTGFITDNLYLILDFGSLLVGSDR
jgi:hypothetical protein